MPNFIKFVTCEQYCCKLVRTKMLIFFLIHSLSSFFTFSLLSLSFSFFFLRHSISVTLSSSFLLLSPEASLPLDFSSLAFFHESRRNCSQKIIFLDINYFFNFSGFCGVEESGGWFQICLLELTEFGFCCLDWTNKKGMFFCFWILALLRFDILLLLLLPISLPMVGWVFSLIDLLGWSFVEDFEFFILFYFIYFVEVFGFGICWRIRWLWM